MSAPIADKSLADLAETFIEINTMTPDQAHACKKLAWWLANTTCGQLITLAEAQAMVDARDKALKDALAYIDKGHHGMARNIIAAAIRTAATSTKDGM